MECGICYDSNLPSGKMETLLCKHSICISCYQKIIIKVCPFCRKRFLPIYKDNKEKEEINSIYVNEINNNSIYRNIEREEIYNTRRTERLLRRQQRREKRKEKRRNNENRNNENRNNQTTTYSSNENENNNLEYIVYKKKLSKFNKAKRWNSLRNQRHLF